jgi:hypothetical protein
MRTLCQPLIMLLVCIVIVCAYWLKTIIFKNISGDFADFFQLTRNRNRHDHYFEEIAGDQNF